MDRSAEVRRALGIIAVLDKEADVLLIEQKMAARYGVLLTFYRAMAGMTNRYCLWSRFVELAEMSEEDAAEVLSYLLDLGMIATAGVWNGRKIVSRSRSKTAENVFRITGQGVDLCERILLSMGPEDALAVLRGRETGSEAEITGGQSGALPA